MAVVGTLIGEFTALFTGLDTRAIPFAEWQRQMGIVARNLQRRVAQSFASGKTAGRAALLANSAKYTAWKIKHGYPKERGQLSRQLLGTLQTAKLTMVTLTMQSATEAAARIVMEEQVLHAMVPHSIPYEDAKVQTEGILSLAASWVREEALKLTARMRAAQARAIANRNRLSGQAHALARLRAFKAARLNIVDTSGQEFLRDQITARRAHAAKILGEIAQPYPGQSKLRENMAAQKAKAESIIKKATRRRK